MMLDINRDGRRDALAPAERTRILRMLRDDSARQADEDAAEGVHIGSIPMMQAPKRVPTPLAVRVPSGPPLAEPPDDSVVHIGTMPDHAAAPSERFLDAPTEISRPSDLRWMKDSPTTEPDARFDTTDEPSEQATILAPREDE